jgi:hypothetical protein
MITKIKSVTPILLTVAGMIMLASCQKSPEEKLNAISPRIQELMCGKMIECTKKEMEQLPESYRQMLPPMMQSKDKCLTFMKEEETKAKAQREANKVKITEEMVNATEKCISAMEKASCEDFKKSSSGPIAGCEDMAKLNK